MKKNSFLVETIRTMVAEDRREMRRAKRTARWDSWLEVAKMNGKKFKVLVKKYGWPTASMVGKRMSRNAWFIVQHSVHDKPFQKFSLKLMKESWSKNHEDICLKNMAFLIDSVSLNQTKKQVFGSQFFYNKKGVFVPRPIKDLKNVDLRRKEYGLPPLKDYLEHAKKHKPKRKKEK